MIRRLVLAFSLCFLAGCGSSTSTRPLTMAGPDAVVADDAEPSGPLVMVVKRPIYDRAGSQSTIDPRTLVAILQPGCATWLAAARLDAAQGLLLVAAMRASLSEAPPAGDSHLALTVSRTLPPADASGQRVVEGGQWQWVGISSVDGLVRCQLSLLDGRGRVLARVSMDTATAAALAADIDRIIRVSTERISSVVQKKD